MPSSSELDEGGWTEVERLVARSLESRPRSLRRRLALFLRFLQWAPLFRYGRPFTAIDADDRARFLDWLERSRIDALRVGFWGIRTLALLGYYGRPSAGRAIGYLADPRGRDAPR